MPILAIANSKGGSGKSTTALNLLEHLKPELVLDADNHQGISQALGRGSYNIECVHITTAAQLVEQLNRDTKGIVVIDCGGFDSDVTRNAIFYADYLIVPSSDDLYEQHALVKFSKYLESVNAKRTTKIKANILLNRVHHSRRDFSIMDKFCSNIESFDRLPVVIPHSAKVSNAAFTGESIKGGYIAAKYAKLASIVKGGLNV